MAEYKIPRTAEAFEDNFQQKKPLMNSTEAFYESSRCLFCYDAPCITACPTGIDIPLFIKQINTLNTKGAAKTIYDSNWLGNACGKVCPTSELCEGACVYNHQGVPPIQIGRLQNYASQKAIESDLKLVEIQEKNNIKVAIIGAGPAGISCACELSKLGYEVDVFEAKEKPSGLTVYGIAPYKITNKEVLDEINYLQKQFNFNINYNAAINNKKQIEELENNYQAIFAAVGMGATATLNIAGEDLKNVVGAVEWIEELRMKQHNLDVNKSVVVIGGGNTAMDAASETAKMGAENVTLAYRRGKESMGAYAFEYNYAIANGVNSLFNAQPVEILGSEYVEGVRFVKTEIVDGKLIYKNEETFVIECELVIKATGQAKQASFYSLIDNIKLDKRNKVQVDLENYQTSNPKYFAGGDAVNGGAEVVNAAYEGKIAAQGIDRWINSK